MNIIKAFGNFLRKHLAIACVCFAAAAMVFPAPFIALTSIKIPLSFIPFLGTHFPSLGFVNIMLAVIMFGMGITLKPADFALVLKRPGDVLLGILSQYIYMAGFGFLVAKAFTLTGIGGPEIAAQIAVGLVLLGCVPGGTASNVMTFLAHGDVALSITMTMCTTLLAPVLTPSLTLLLAGAWIAVDFWSMFFSIIVVVFLPIVAGIAVNALLGSKAEKLNNALVSSSAFCILLVVSCCVAPNRSTFLNNGIALVAATSIAVLVHHLLGLGAGYLTSKMFGMSEEKVRAFSLEVGLQNSGLSCTLANTAFAGTMAVMPCVLATVIHQIVGPIVAGAFAARDNAEDSAEEFAAESD